MARPAQSAVQRIQVGLLGLVAVLLFVSIANMILDRADSNMKPTQASTVTDRKDGKQPGIGRDIGESDERLAHFLHAGEDSRN